MIGNDLTDKSEARKLKNEIAAFREFMLTTGKGKRTSRTTEDIHFQKSGYRILPHLKKERRMDPETCNLGIP